MKPSANAIGPTVTIGIPAYNEAHNIGFLLQDLLEQRTATFQLEKILVALDGCTDATAEEIAKLNNHLIGVIENPIREGVGSRQNQLLAKTRSDIAVLLNADIAITDLQFLERLVAPIIAGKADMTAPRITPMASKTFFESVLVVSVKLKWAIFERINMGNTIYTCSGIARAFTKKAYDNLRFHQSVGEDAFSYLYASAHGFRYQYVKTTEAFYRLPTTFTDHAWQSVRFFTSKRLYEADFPASTLAVNYSIPKLLALRIAAWYCLRYPVHLAYYAVILLLLRHRSSTVTLPDNTWHVAESSKLVRSTP